jgi:hypothetical protein
MDNKIPAGELIVPAEPVRKFAAQWAAQKKTDAWKFAGARSASRWEDEFPSLTEAEFDAAIQAVCDIRIG